MKQITTIILILASVICTAQEKFTIVLDPGHGGFDPGAIGNNIVEKNLVLNYALEIGQIINQQDRSIEVIYTRTKDKFIPLHQRANIANINQAQLFISIHVNSYSMPSVNGFETYIVGMHGSEEVLNIAKKENAVILIEENYETFYEGFDPNSSESYILFDLIQEEHLLNSAEFSVLIQTNIRRQAKRTIRGTNQAGFLVLKEANSPSALIELGYLTNQVEANYLLSEKGKREICNAIAKSIIEYKQNQVNLQQSTLGSIK
ncbi:MAG: N-acetylmuramoyl-L-alanine amidase [Mangrovibacterium sp.]